MPSGTRNPTERFSTPQWVFTGQLNELLNRKYEFEYGEVPPLKGDSRDVKAVTRLSSALSKLLLISIDDLDYKKYVLKPAFALRTRVREQLAELNPDEFQPTVNIDFEL